MEGQLSGALFDPILGGMSRVLTLRQQQHTVTASNIANAETPGYKAKVVDFRDALSTAMDTGNKLQMRRTNVRHGSGGDGMENPVISELEAPPWSTDGNSVVAEREMARLQENALMYRAVSGGLSRRLAMLKYAASDGK